MNKKITKIREATERDILPIAEIYKQAIHRNYSGAGEYYLREEYTDPNYESSSGPYHTTETLLKSNLRTLKKRIKSPYTTYVILEKEKVVGYIIVENHLGRYWVNDLVISSEFRNKGYARELFDYAMKDKKDVYLWVTSKNPAKKFWEKLGFKEVLKESLMKK